MHSTNFEYSELDKTIEFNSILPFFEKGNEVKNEEDLVKILFPPNFSNSSDEFSEDSNIYYKENWRDLNNQSNSSVIIEIPKIKEINEVKTKIFEIVKNKNRTDNMTHKKRGREKQNKNNKIIHDRNSKDNLIGKIQCHYLKFLVNFTNEIIKQYLKELHVFFIPFDHQETCSVSATFINKLKNYSLADLFTKLQKSKKYSKYKEEHNLHVYQKICLNFPQMKKFLDETNYLDLFNSVYYKEDAYQRSRKVDMKEFGLDYEIVLTEKIEMKKDLLNKNIEDKNYSGYKMIMENAVRDYYLGKFKVKKGKK